MSLDNGPMDHGSTVSAIDTESSDVSSFDMAAPMRAPINISELMGQLSEVARLLDSAETPSHEPRSEPAVATPGA